MYTHVHVHEYTLVHVILYAVSSL